MTEALRMVAEHPGSGFVFISASFMALFFAVKLYVSISHIEASFVTKKDLQIALLELKDELGKIYITKEECNIIEQRNGRGGQFGP